MDGSLSVFGGLTAHHGLDGDVAQKVAHSPVAGGGRKERVEAEWRTAAASLCCGLLFGFRRWRVRTATCIGMLPVMCTQGA